MSVDAESHLRSITSQSLAEARPGRSQLVPCSGIQAVANAFVMLGLLAESVAEEILDEHLKALESRGIERKGWDLDLIEGSSHGYWEARTGPRNDVPNIPLSAVPARICCSTSFADVYIDWVTLTSSGLRLRVRSFKTQDGATGPHPGGELPELVVTDDSGRTYSLRFDGGYSTMGFWEGEIKAEPSATDAAWVEFGPSQSGQPERVVFPPPVSVEVGRSEPPWPTPAETYLAWLSQNAPTQRWDEA